MKVISLYSGGKDSTRAIEIALSQGHHVSAVLVMHSAEPHSHMFHTPTIELTALQAQAMGLPLRTAATSGIEGAELDDLEAALALAQDVLGIEGVVSGALRSRYQKDRIDRLCAKRGLASIAPLWGIDALTHIRDLIARRYSILFTAVASEGLDATWLGRTLDEQALEHLQQLHAQTGLNLDGEGGEYETLVLWAPMFRQRLQVRLRPQMGPRSGRVVVEEASLVPVVHEGR